MSDIDGEQQLAALQSIDTGAALADAKTWIVAIENAAFFNWFAPAVAGNVDAPLPERLPGLDETRARARMADGRPFAYEATAGTGARAKTVAPPSSRTSRPSQLRLPPLRGVDRLNQDEITIPDPGVPQRCRAFPISPDHAHNLARCALRMRRYLEKRNASTPVEWRCRIGIATGPVIGSIVGI